MINPSEQGITAKALEAFVNECRKSPMDIDLQGIQDFLDMLNTKTLETDYEFHFHQVVDDVVLLNVAPYYFDGKTLRQPIKLLEKVGPVIQSVLDKLPSSVRTGQDENFEVYQIRCDYYNSFEHLMGKTTLLTVFLNIRSEGGCCYFLPNDPNSMTNWQALKNMHAEHFPQLPAGR